MEPSDPDPEAAKRPYHHGRLRDDLVAAGLEIVRQTGPDALSTRACAKAAGVSSGAVFRHFRDKRALATAIATEGFALMSRRVAAEVARATTPMDRFRAVGVGYLDFALDEPHLFRLMFRADTIDRTDADFLAASAPMAEAVDAEDGRISEYGLLGWAISHGLATLTIDSVLESRLPEDDAARRAILYRALERLAPALSDQLDD